MGIAPDSIMGKAVDFVADQISSNEVLIHKHSETLQSALSTLATIRVGEVDAPTRITPTTTQAPVFALGDAPTFSVSPLEIPEFPGTTFSIDGLLASLDLSDLEEMPTPPATLALNLPDAPGFTAKAAPSRPSVDTNIDLPDAPTLALPEMEALQQISIPDFTFPTLPDFNGSPPTLDVAVPNVFINWAEPQYASELLPELQAKVRSMMEGGTGLPAAVEDALFSRARERDSAETSRAVQEAFDTWASRGFSMPPGMLAKQVNVAQEAGRLKAAETNRDILTQAAQWEIENIRFAVQQGIALEQLTQNLFENTVKRLFEVARFQAESQISVFNAQIGLFNAQNAAFETLANVYKTRLEGALAKLQAYKTAIDGQVALGQLNIQKVEVFKAKLSAVMSSVELYKASMEGAKVRAELISVQFDAYKADVQAFAEEMGAEKLKFEAYDAQVRGETAKAGVLETQARTYASTIQGIATKADIKSKFAQLKMEAAKTLIQKYLADTDLHKTKIDAAVRQSQNNLLAFQSQIEGWKAKTSANVAASEVQSKYADMATRTNIAFSEVQMSEYNAKMTHAVQLANVTLEATKAIGQYSAQLAAGAMSAMHVSAGVSASGGATSTEATNKNTTTTYNYSY